MTKENNKLEITYKEKKYEIEPKKDEQVVIPKGQVKPTDATKHPDEITVKNYEEGGFLTSHKCECSKDGTTFEKIDIKWGTKKHITIWGGSSVVVFILGAIGYFGFRNKKEEKEESF